MLNKKHTSITLILPEKPILFFGSTSTKQKVKGKLSITTKQPIGLTQIKLYYKVISHLHYQDESSTSLLANRMVASKTIRESVQNLIEKDTIIPTGITLIDFEVHIPNHLPLSLESKYCDIQHTLSAKLATPSRMIPPILNQTIRLQVRKTFIPKETLMGIVPSIVPKLAMTGEKVNLIQWQFQAPIWACLQNNIEVEDFFHMPTQSATLKKIQTDVMQEELYFYDSSCTDMKRRLVTNTANPSTYIEPPSNSIIYFSIPFFNEKKNHIIWSLEDSPFSRVSHFIRVILHINNGTSICISLPIQVTPQFDSSECIEYLQLNDEARDDMLPTYDTVINQGERLPKYKSHKKYIRSQQWLANANHNNSNAIIRQRISYQPVLADKNLSMAFAHLLIAEIEIGERRIKEFCTI